MNNKALLFDGSKCMGCRGCQVACKQWNQLPAVTTKNTGSYENPPELTPYNFTTMGFREVETRDGLKWLFLKKQCLHCTDAACVQICPVDARSKDEFGFTEIDIKKCIGCGLCVKACPFDVPRVDNKTNKVTGCSFCLDRVTNGLIPACAKTCPTGAVRYGERSDIISYAYDVMAKSKEALYLYGERLFGGLHVLYLLPEKPSVYDLPEVNEAEITNSLQAVAYLDKTLPSDIKEAVLTAAALKYFGHVSKQAIEKLVTRQ